MIRQRSFAAVFGAIALAITAYAQQFPPQGDDATSSLGSFKVYIAPNFVNLFYNSNFPNNKCPLFDPTTQILSSPSPLFDGATVIGRSDPLLDGSNGPPGMPSDLGGVSVGSAQTNVSESMLIPPPGFPCSGVSGCSSGPGTREVHTEVRSLHMTGGGAAVRAGVWYNSPNGPSTPPARISPGEVESQSGPGGPLNKDFRASSFFDVYVQVDIPACGSFQGAFPGGTLYNLMPLVVKNNMVITFPPNVVYLHDASSIVPILFLYDNLPFWHKDDILGYFLLVGHGVGFGQGQNDLNNFNNAMQGQSNAACPIPPPPPPPAQPKPTPTPTPSASRSAAEPKPASGGGHR